MRYVKLFEEFEKKKMLGSGSYCHVYDSKSFQDRVLKKWDPLDVHHWEPIFKMYKNLMQPNPHLFAKIYSIDEKRAIVVQEKVKLKPLSYFEDLLKPHMETNYTIRQLSYDIIDYYENGLVYVEDKNLHEQPFFTSGVVGEALSFLKEVDGIIKSIMKLDGFLEYRYGELDFHINNFGWDAQNKIKFIDL